MSDQQKKTHSYQCRDCKRLELSGLRDAVRCSGCGCRILEKLRKDECTQYEGR